MSTPKRLAGLVGAALLTALLAACGSDGEAPPAPPAAASVEATDAGSASAQPGAAVATPRPTDQAVSQPTPRPTQVSLSDGGYEARIVDVDAARGRVTVDVVEFLTGREAARAAAEAGAEVPPPNDYYIRNSNPRLRILRVAPGAPITVNTLGSAETGSTSVDVSTTLPRLAATPHVDRALFRLTVDDGGLTRIAEIYLP